MKCWQRTNFILCIYRALWKYKCNHFIKSFRFNQLKNGRELLKMLSMQFLMSHPLYAIYSIDYKSYFVPSKHKYRWTILSFLFHKRKWNKYLNISQVTFILVKNYYCHVLISFIWSASWAKILSLLTDYFCFAD